MKIVRPTLIIVAALLSSPACRSAEEGSIHWSWHYDQTQYTLSSLEPIIINATLLNDLASGGNLRGPGVGLSFTGDLQKIYDFTGGPPGEGFGPQFSNLNLVPGASFRFVFGTLTPINGFAPPGTYHSDLAFLSINGSERFPDSGFEVTVIPEPSSLALLCLAGIGLAGARLVWKWKG